MSLPVVSITRKESFSASHRLHSHFLSDEENQKVYGKCNHINGHGHNYVVEVTVQGPVDIKTGMIMNITELDECIKKVVFKNLDHKNLDKDVEFFRCHPSTMENVSIYIYEQIRGIMAHPELLYEVRVEETQKNSAVFRGQYPSEMASNGLRMQSKKCNISSDSD